MGLDIGSGSTKMMVAKVDICKNKILDVLHNESQSVQYNEDLEKNADGNLSPTIIVKGQEVLTEMLKKGRTFNPKKFTVWALQFLENHKMELRSLRGSQKN